MIAITRDAAWAARLDDLAAKGGWPFAASDALPSARSASSERALVVLDRMLAGASPARTVAGLKAMFTSARIVLACTEAELGADGVALGLQCGADDVVSKSWTDAKLGGRFSSLRDAALAEAVRVSDDGALKAELRSRRVFLRSRSRWSELAVPAAEFALLWRLLGAGGRTVEREELLEALRSVTGRDVESETVSRRVLSLRRALAPWKGAVEPVRGGSYRLSSSRRRSTT